MLYQSIEHRARELKLSRHLPNWTMSDHLPDFSEWTVRVLKIFTLSLIASLPTVIKIKHREYSCSTYIVSCSQTKPEWSKVTFSVHTNHDSVKATAIVLKSIAAGSSWLFSYKENRTPKRPSLVRIPPSSLAQVDTEMRLLTNNAYRYMLFLIKKKPTQTKTNKDKIKQNKKK